MPQRFNNLSLICRLLQPGPKCWKPQTSALECTGWPFHLFKTSRWLQNKSSALAWPVLAWLGQNRTSVLKSTGGFEQVEWSPCNEFTDRIYQWREGATSVVCLVCGLVRLEGVKSRCALLMTSTIPCLTHIIYFVLPNIRRPRTWYPCPRARGIGRTTQRQPEKRALLLIDIVDKVSCYFVIFTGLSISRIQYFLSI